MDKMLGGYQALQIRLLNGRIFQKILSKEPEASRSNVSFALRLTADGLKRFCYSVTLTNTRSDTGDQGASRTHRTTT